MTRREQEIEIRGEHARIEEQHENQKQYVRLQEIFSQINAEVKS
jgi:hypothetical protein